MARLLFKKTGSAVWISHLDLMRLFQRAFKRAGLELTHTQGFNPRPSVSIALPLSVGTASHCELLDFTLDAEMPDAEIIKQRLNKALVAGVCVEQVYDNGRKLKELSYLSCQITLDYDKGIPTGAAEEIGALFSRDALIVEKKSKNGIVEQDILPMIRKIDISSLTETKLMLQAMICCQNPSLNPQQIVAAIDKYLPDLHPDFVQCCRTELYDNQETVFR